MENMTTEISIRYRLLEWNYFAIYMLVGWVNTYTTFEGVSSVQKIYIVRRHTVARNVSRIVEKHVPYIAFDPRPATEKTKREIYADATDRTVEK